MPFATAMPRLEQIATMTVSALSSSWAMSQTYHARGPVPSARARGKGARRVQPRPRRVPVRRRRPGPHDPRRRRAGVRSLGCRERRHRGVGVRRLGEGDRLAAGSAPGGRLDLAGHDTGGAAPRLLPLDETTFRRAYNPGPNSTLWYVNHTPFDTPRQPVFDARWSRYWDAYVDYNASFADALAEEAADGARVLVQDYHLFLVPALLRARRPDLRIGHFTHTPWAEPSYFSVLPDAIGTTILEGMLGADSVGFLSPRWAEAFVRCCVRLLGAQAGGETVHY